MIANLQPWFGSIEIIRNCCKTYYRVWGLQGIQAQHIDYTINLLLLKSKLL